MKFNQVTGRVEKNNVHLVRGIESKLSYLAAHQNINRKAELKFITGLLKRTEETLPSINLLWLLYLLIWWIRSNKTYYYEMIIGMSRVGKKGFLCIVWAIHGKYGLLSFFFQDLIRLGGTWALSVDDLWSLDGDAWHYVILDLVDRHICFMKLNLHTCSLLDRGCLFLTLGYSVIKVFPVAKKTMVGIDPYDCFDVGIFVFKQIQSFQHFKGLLNLMIFGS